MKWKLLGALVLTFMISQTVTAVGPAPIKTHHFVPVAVPSFDIPAPIIVDNLVVPTLLPRPTPLISQPTPKIVSSPTIKPLLTPAPKVYTGVWIHDFNISWYGPGFYGQGLACGGTLTKTQLGVAHKTLPCGTLVEFKYHDKSVVVPVIDRGPYVTGRQWDLTGGLCIYLNHCFTGDLWYRIVH